MLRSGAGVTSLAFFLRAAQAGETDEAREAAVRLSKRREQAALDRPMKLRRGRAGPEAKRFKSRPRSFG
jgi:hypothetical protein